MKDFNTPGWVALYGPKGMPADAVAKLQAAVAQVLATPDVVQRFAAAGAAAQYMDAATLARYEQAEIKKWGEAVGYSGARLD